MFSWFDDKPKDAFIISYLFIYLFFTAYGCFPAHCMFVCFEWRNGDCLVTLSPLQMVTCANSKFTVTNFCFYLTHKQFFFLCLTSFCNKIKQLLHKIAKEIFWPRFCAVLLLVTSQGYFSYQTCVQVSHRSSAFITGA